MNGGKMKQKFILNQLFLLGISTVFTKDQGQHPLGIPPNNHGIQPQIYHKEVIRPAKGQLFKTIEVLSPEWSLEFQFRAYDVFEKWGGVFHITGPSVNKIPIVLLYRSTFGSVSMRITATISGNNRHTTDVQNVDLNQINSVKIQQRYVSNGQYLYSIFFNEEEKHSAINTMAKQDYGVKIYLSDATHRSAKVDVWNIKYTNFL